MLNELLTGVLDAVKLAPRYLAPVGLVAAMLLFVPQEYLQVVGVHQLAQDYRPVLGLALLFCIATLVMLVGHALWRSTGSRWRRYKFRRCIHQRLGRLSEDEKQILRFYISQQTRANTLRIDDGVVQGLVAAGVIYRSAQIGSLVDGFSHNISEIAWKHLDKNEVLLEGSTNTYRTDKRPRYW